LAHKGGGAESLLIKEDGESEAVMSDAYERVGDGLGVKCRGGLRGEY
jgi:hypothetical protein